MVWARVSIIWLNYNSSKILPIVLKSLESIIDLDYPSDRYELIVVDNGSTDGSFERIREFLEKRGGLRKKVIRLSKNLGFTGGNNVGFSARDRESRYVLLLNNDAVLLQHGLRTLIEYAEDFDGVGGLQGVVLKFGTRVIDTAGDFVSELLQSYTLGVYREYPWVLRKPIYVTYTDGCCSMYRVDAVLKCVGNRLFIDEFFGYGDDNVLGLMLWSCGYKLVAVPEVVASHARGLTFGKKSTLSAYISERNRVTLSVVTNTRYRQIVLLHATRNTVTSALRTGLRGFTGVRARVLVDGLRLGKKLKRRGISIDIYKAPIIKIPLKDVPLFFTARHVVSRYLESRILNELSKLVVE
jgi:Predicted glycosyltransferases